MRRRLCCTAALSLLVLLCLALPETQALQTPYAGSGTVSKTLTQLGPKGERMTTSLTKTDTHNVTNNKAAKIILDRQLAQIRQCFPLLHNSSLPVVIDRTFFPKYQSKPQRFRYHCSKVKQPKDYPLTIESTFLSSYGIDQVFLPEWVAFKITRPVFGVSRIPKTTREDCIAKGGGKFYSIKENGIRTPDTTFTMYYDLKLLNAGKDRREGIQKGQLCLPTNSLTCAEKEGTYAMTNVIPINKYLYSMNWAEADKAMRKYVALDVDPPRNGTELLDLVMSKKYHAIHAVAGVHFVSPQVDKFDWVYEQDDINDYRKVKRSPIPHFVWQAVVDPKKVSTNPAQAAIAWYCNNRPKGPWPPLNVGNVYENGPKLCRVLSLKQLEETVGIRPFPDLPKEVIEASPFPAAWYLSEKF